MQTKLNLFLAVLALLIWIYVMFELQLTICVFLII